MTKLSTPVALALAVLTLVVVAASDMLLWPRPGVPLLHVVAVVLAAAVPGRRAVLAVALAAVGLTLAVPAWHAGSWSIDQVFVRVLAIGVVLSTAAAQFRPRAPSQLDRNTSPERVTTGVKPDGIEHRHRTIFDRAPFAMALGRAQDSTVVSVNAAFEQLFDVRASDILGRRALDVGIGDARSRDEVLNQFRRHGQLRGHLLQIRTAHGATRWLALSLDNLDIDGVPHLLATFQDVSAQHQAEDALRASEERLRLVVEHSNDAINLLDLATGRYVYMSPAQVRLTGFGADELASQSAEAFLARVHPDDRHLPAEQQRRMAAGEVTGPTTVEYRWQRKDGEYHWFNDTRSVVRDVQGQPRFLAGTSRDITTQKQAQAALVASEERYRALFDSMDQGFAVCKPLHGADGSLADLRVVEVNPASRRHTGLLTQDLVGRLVSELVGPLDAMQRHTYQRVLETREAVQLDVRFDALDRWLEVIAFRFDGGELAFLFHDCTARKQAELAMVREKHDLEVSMRQQTWQLEDETRVRQAAEAEIERTRTELRQRAEELQRRTEQLRRLASELTVAEQRARDSLAHMLHDDLQQLLVSALMQLDAMAPPAAGTSADLLRLRADLEQAVEAARSLAVEIMPPVLQQGDLPEALEWLAGWMRKKYGLTVQTSLAPEGNPPTREMRTLVFESVRELLFNVVKHAGVKRAWLSSARRPDGMIQVMVGDHGAGFDPEAAFDARRQTRSGLGLFSVRERLALAHGRLEVHSAPGSGARFSLIVPGELEPAPAPVVQAPAPSPPPPPRWRADAGPVQPETAPPPAPPPPKPPSAGLRVLLADDHASVRAALRELLALQNDVHVVGEAEDGLEAVEKAQKLRPDVIVMDVHMPRLDGLAATRQLRATLPDAVVVGISTDDQASLRQAVLDAGAAAFIVKGTGTPELLAFVRDLQAARGAAA